MTADSISRGFCPCQGCKKFWHLDSIWSHQILTWSCGCILSPGAQTSKEEFHRMREFDNEHVARTAAISNIWQLPLLLGFSNDVLHAINGLCPQLSSVGLLKPSTTRTSFTWSMNRSGPAVSESAFLPLHLSLTPESFRAVLVGAGEGGYWDLQICSNVAVSYNEDIYLCALASDS